MKYITLIIGLLVVGCGNSDKVKLLEEQSKRLEAEAKVKLLEEKGQDSMGFILASNWLTRTRHFEDEDGNPSEYVLWPLVVVAAIIIVTLGGAIFASKLRKYLRKRTMLNHTNRNCPQETQKKEKKVAELESRLEEKDK